MDIAKMASNKLGMMDDAIITSIDRRPDQASGGAVERSYKVQFNPNELTIDASVPVEPLASSEQNSTVGSETVIPLQTDNPTIFLTVRLIFDEMVSEGVFLSNDTIVSAPGLTKKAANTAKDKLSGRKGTRSVQPIVEGFIGAIRNSYTRMLRFNWGEFRFTGFLENIHADYVMFSPEGDPVRAYVTLRIQNDFQSEAHIWYEEMDRIWENDTDRSPTGRLKSAASNVLNMNW
jgi:hypothetical protein